MHGPKNKKVPHIICCAVSHSGLRKTLTPSRQIYYKGLSYSALKKISYS